MRTCFIQEEVTHDGHTNKNSTEFKGNKITLVYLSPFEVYQDQKYLSKNKKNKTQSVTQTLITKKNSKSLRKTQKKKL